MYMAAGSLSAKIYARLREVNAPPLRYQKLARNATRITGYHFGNALTNFLGIRLCTTNDRLAGSAENELLRVRVNKVQNHRAFVVLIDVDIGHRSTRPHSIMTVTVWP